MFLLENAMKQYRLGNETVYALNHISLQIDDHEFVSITGPSGSGKTTLMNIIGCLDTLDSGKYSIDSKDLCNYSEKELGMIRSKKIGFVFQQFNLLPKLTAYENIELPLIYQGFGKTARKKAVSNALEHVGLSGRVKHKPFQLSGGQQQRVAIARALVTNPSLILADEPTGNLDSKSSAEIMRLLQDTHGQGNTILLITHDDTIAAEAKRQVRIMDGTIISDSKMKEQ